jgi:hypothetical protein
MELKKVQHTSSCRRRRRRRRKKKKKKKKREAERSTQNSPQYFETKNWKQNKTKQSKTKSFVVLKSIYPFH